MTAPNKNLQLQLPYTTRFKLFISSLMKRIIISPDGTINGRLARLLDIKAPAPATKLINTTTVSTADIPIDPSINLWMRCFVPKTTTTTTHLPLIVYYHGGGFIFFGPDTKVLDNFCSHLAAKLPAVVLSVNYRLAPQHRYPTQYDDAYEALKFIDAAALDVFPPNTDFTSCYIAGESAGANIAHHVTFRACKNSREFNRLKFAGVLSLQPFFGGEDRTDSELRLKNPHVVDVWLTDLMWRHFLPEGSDRDHPAAHVWGDSDATEELKMMEFPGVFVGLGGFDPLQDWGRRYVEWLRSCGKSVELVEYPNAFHGSFGFPELPEFNGVMEDIAVFVKNQSGMKN